MKINPNFEISRQQLGMHLLRLGLAFVFLWFGFSQLLDSLKWVDIVPDWAINILHLPPALIVIGNGLFEITLGSLLAMGFFVRIISFVLALHLIPIALEFGFVATGVRDLGIAIASLALSLMYTKDEEPKQPESI
ncbi:DoxX family protein [Candidatus Nomurabacteria bacterium]|nr:DoxX family protein [Candidatus Nomurabacteria bacterium]